jgi:hypothetical protein
LSKLKHLNPHTTIRKIQENEEGSSPPSKMVVSHIYKEKGGSSYFIMNLSMLDASLLISKMVVSHIYKEKGGSSYFIMNLSMLDASLLISK